MMIVIVRNVERGVHLNKAYFELLIADRRSHYSVVGDHSFSHCRVVFFIAGCLKIEASSYLSLVDQVLSNQDIRDRVEVLQYIASHLEDAAFECDPFFLNLVEFH